MFILKGTFEKLKEDINKPSIKINCNHCIKQERCLRDKRIGYETYPNGEHGLAKINVHHFDNSCTFLIKETI